MKLTELERCPLCQGRRIRLFKKGTIDPQAIGAADFKITDSHYGSRWTLYSCRDCAFVFANPLPDGEAIAGFYAALDDEEYSQEDEGRGRNFAVILRRLGRLAPHGRGRLAPHGRGRLAPSNGSLLDVGAASGIFLNLARRAGYDAAGIEPSERLVADAERLYGLKIFCGSAEQFPFGRTFDVVTLLDVLEHVTDPGAFLDTVAKFLAPGGTLVIVTPDIGSLAARLMGGRWWHYRAAHVNFFNRRSLERLLAAHGLTVVLRKRFAWNFSVYYLLTRLLPFLKGKTLQRPLKKLHLKLQLFDSWEVYARKTEK